MVTEPPQAKGETLNPQDWGEIRRWLDLVEVARRRYSPLTPRLDKGWKAPDEIAEDDRAWQP